MFKINLKVRSYIILMEILYFLLILVAVSYNLLSAYIIDQEHNKFIKGLRSTI